MFGFEFRKSFTKFKETIIGRQHLSYGLFHHLGILFLHPRILLIFEQFPVEELGKFTKSEVGFVRIVSLLFAGEHLIIYKSVAAKHPVECLFLPLVGIQPYFYRSQYHKSSKWVHYPFLLYKYVVILKKLYFSDAMLR